MALSVKTGNFGGGSTGGGLDLFKLVASSKSKPTTLYTTYFDFDTDLSFSQTKMRILVVTRLGTPTQSTNCEKIVIPYVQGGYNGFKYYARIGGTFSMAGGTSGCSFSLASRRITISVPSDYLFDTQCEYQLDVYET